MTTVKPYKIAVPDSALQRLKDKLALTTFPDETDFSDSWDYGAPMKDIERLVRYWRDGFDWRAVEARLNEQLPQFTTTISVDGFEDLNIHFVHQRSSDPSSIPLLFCHGWPGSFLEVAKILPLLTSSDGAGPSFHVVAPSLPNFGFSQGVSKPGFSIPQYAEVCHKLMQRLGYARYATQGGDWGFSITRTMAMRYPAHCLANHLNFLHASFPWPHRHPLLFLQLLLALPFSAYQRAGLRRSLWWRDHGMGYFHEQSTRPHTLGVALADSPAGLLAWVYEKLHDWTDDYPWTDDEVLTWIGVYQFSAAGPAASVRIYYEFLHVEKDAVARMLRYNPDVPIGVSYFPRDLVVMPRAFAGTLGPVVFAKCHDDGGHFAAVERPERLVEDLRAMFGKGGGAYGVTKKLAPKL